MIDRLESDHDYLTEGGVFTSDLIETYITVQAGERDLPIQIRPPPTLTVRALLRRLSRTATRRLSRTATRRLSRTATRRLVAPRRDV